jgi:hypothetical protein
MAQNPQPKPTLKQFLEDPAYKEDKDFLWAAFDSYVAEKRAADEATRQNTEPTFLESVLGPFAPRRGA